MNTQIQLVQVVPVSATTLLQVIPLHSCAGRKRSRGRHENVFVVFPFSDF